ncbi:Glycine cleavage system H protein [Bienertia sinuspersici]
MEDSFTPLSLRRRGSKIPVDIYETPKGNLQSLVVGKDWVCSWITRDRVDVTHDNDVLYSFFHHEQYWDTIVSYYHYLNFKGGLIILRPWSYTMSYKSINFTESSLWVKVEGIPYILSTEDFAQRVFGTARGTKLGKPLVPGCYIEYEPNNLIWVDIRYEGVFHFCKKCGIIGHDTLACRCPRDLAEQNINARIAAYSPLYDVVFGQADRQLYTNKIRGLPNTPPFHTTRVNLFTTPNSARHWHPFTHILTEEMEGAI